MNIRLYRTDYEGDIADQEADRILSDVRCVVVRGSAVEVSLHGAPAEEFDADEYTVCVIP